MIKGKYVFKSNGQIVAEKENILTANGIEMINRYLANSINEWAGTIAVGSLFTTAASTDQTLSYEISRSPVTLKSFTTNSGSNQIVLKTSLDPLLVGSIYEIGVIPLNYTNSGKRDNFYISQFDEIYGTSSSSQWYTGSSVATAQRTLISSGSSRHGLYNILVPTSGSLATISGLGLDITGYTPNDYLQLLYYVPATSTNPSLTFTLFDTNAASWSSSTRIVTTSAVGYYSASVQMFNTPTTGFNYILDRFSASFAGGTGSVSLDSIKFMSGDNKVAEELLVSRTSSSIALTTTKYGQPLEVEYYLTVT